MESDWSDLPEDMLLLIHQRLDKFVDHVRFSQVCKSWRADFHLPQPPLLLVNNVALVEPRSRSNRSIYKFEFPELRHRCCIGSIGTWVVSTDTQQKILLTNPFSSSAVTLLPPVSTFKSHWDDFGDCFLFKVVLSSSPSSSSSRGMMALALSDMYYFGIARPGDRAWKMAVPNFPDGHTPPSFHDAIFYQEKFYLIDQFGDLFVCNNVDGSDVYLHPRLTLVISKFSRGFEPSIERSSIDSKNYLVEVTGDLILVLRFRGMVPKGVRVVTDKFEVYKADFTAMEWVKVKSLGSHSLFLGLNTSVSVMASQSSSSNDDGDNSCVFRKNCIYFTDDYMVYEGPSSDVGVFNLEDGRIEPIYTGTSASLIESSVWIVPRSITN